jgi:hypothetical protein
MCMVRRGRRRGVVALRGRVRRLEGRNLRRRSIWMRDGGGTFDAGEVLDWCMIYHYCMKRRVKKMENENVMLPGIAKLTRDSVYGKTKQHILMTSCLQLVYSTQSHFWISVAIHFASAITNTSPGTSDANKLTISPNTRRPNVRLMYPRYCHASALSLTLYFNDGVLTPASVSGFGTPLTRRMRLIYSAPHLFRASETCILFALFDCCTCIFVIIANVSEYRSGVYHG